VLYAYFSLGAARRAVLLPGRSSAADPRRGRRRDLRSPLPPLPRLDPVPASSGAWPGVRPQKQCGNRRPPCLGGWRPRI